MKDSKAALSQKLSDPREDLYIKLEAAGSLAQLGETEGLDFLFARLKNGSLTDKFRVVLILGEINQPKAVALLANVLSNKDEHPEIRAAAAQSLGKIGGVFLSVAFKALIDAFTYPDIRIRRYAVRGLISMRELVMQHLIDALGSSVIDISAGAAWCLSKVGECAIKPLINALDDSKKRQWIAFALGKMDKGLIEPEIRLIKDQYPEVHFTATALLSVPSWITELESEL